MTDIEVRAALERHVQNFVDEICEDGDFWWGRKTVQLMANAAWLVLYATKDLTEYFESEDMLK